MDNKPIILQNFINFNELEQVQEDLDEEKITENIELTEQEIESLTQILN